MNAKEAIMEELGNFGKEGEASALAADEKPPEGIEWPEDIPYNAELKPVEGRLEDMRFAGFEYEDGKKYGLVLEDDEAEEGEEGEGEEGAQAPDGKAELTEEQYRATMEAVWEALKDPKMPQEQFEWGLQYIDAMFRERILDRLRKIEALTPEEVNRGARRIIAKQRAQEARERDNYIKQRPATGSAEEEAEVDEEVDAEEEN